MRVEHVEFRSELELKAGAGDNEWVLLADFKAKVFYDDHDEEWIIVPKGFDTDLASVPRFPGMFLLFGGRARKSAVLHDFLYTARRDREFADAVFYAAMRNEENWFTRSMMWLGVRLGGGMYYREPKP